MRRSPPRARLIGPGVALLVYTRAAAALVRASVAVTPIQKVSELLVKLRDQVQKEGLAEAASYDKFACFCKEQSNDKVYTIEKSAAKIEALTAAVTDLAAEIAQLDSEVVTLKANVATEEAEAKTALDQRTGEVTLYEGKRANLTSGIKSIAGAIETLQASRDEVQKSAALAQAQVVLQKAGVQRPTSFLATNLRSDPGTPKAYEYKANDIIATLQELLKTFKAELAGLDSEEGETAHSYDMIEGARANKVKFMQAGIQQKDALSAQKSGEKSEKDQLLADETTAKSADQAFLDELTATCQSKAEAWDARSKTRAAEITVLTEAITTLEGLSSGQAPAAASALLLQRSSRLAPAQPHGVGAAVAEAPALLQIAAAVSAPPASAALARALALLEKRAEALGNKGLAKFALSLTLNDGPDHFVKVRGIINDLITKLEAEASEEATAKSFCDTQMKDALTKRDQYQGDVESATASIEATTSAIKELELSIATLGEEIAALYKALKEMTDLRAEEKAANAKAQADAEAASISVKQALQALQKFYGSAGGALLQLQASYTPTGGDRQGNTVSDLAPETFSGEYSGKIAESKGILGLLEIIASDFDAAAAAAQANEQSQADVFEKQSTLTNTEISDKEKAKADQESQKDAKSTELVGFQGDLKTASGLHETALKELEVLSSSCVESSETWEERKANRQKEVEALKQALQILEEWKS